MIKKYEKVHLEGFGFSHLRLVEKVLRLTELLNEINKDRLLGKVLALKGGTPLNLLLLDLPRLSVNIDLNYTGSIDKETMLKEQSEINDSIVSIAKFLGYKLSPEKTYSSWTYTLRYIPFNSANYDETLQIDINYILRVPVYKTHKSKPKNILRNSKIGSVHLLSNEEIIAAKLSAFVTRLSPRDIFDAFQIAINPDFYDFEKLKKGFIFYRCLQDEGFVFDINERIETINLKRLQTEISQFIGSSIPINYSKLKSLLKSFFDKLLVLDKNETQFIELFSKKEYRPELLFNERINDLRKHPRVEWMFKNRT